MGFKNTYSRLHWAKVVHTYFDEKYLSLDKRFNLKYVSVI